MKSFITCFIVVSLFISCNGTDNNNATNNRDTTTSKVNTSRLILIEQLKKLNAILASNDKEQVVNLFPFPLKQDAFSIYINDTTVRLDEHHLMTKAIFLNHFKQISEEILLDKMNSLFSYLQVDSLINKDKLEFDAFNKNEPCYFNYKIEIKDSKVTLSINGNSNRKFKSKSLLNSDDIPENASEICEHNFWWIFNFDGKSLHLISISGAD